MEEALSLTLGVCSWHNKGTGMKEFVVLHFLCLCSNIHSGPRRVAAVKGTWKLCIQDGEHWEVLGSSWVLSNSPEICSGVLLHGLIDWKIHSPLIWIFISTSLWHLPGSPAGQRRLQSLPASAGCTKDSFGANYLTPVWMMESPTDSFYLRGPHSVL